MGSVIHIYENVIVVKVGEGCTAKKEIIQLFVLDRDKTGKLERPLELWLHYLAKLSKVYLRKLFYRELICLTVT